MELTVNKAGKYALVWLTNAEKADPKVMDSLQPLIEQCKEKKYRLAIFESGEQDLLEKTTDLLIHNRGLEKTDDGKTTALPKQASGELSRAAIRPILPHIVSFYPKLVKLG